MIYCIVPRDLAPKLHEALRRHFRDDASVEVVVERRSGERRRRLRRATEGAASRRYERRRIRNVEGRRVGERRVASVPVEAPARPLPRAARRHAERLAFVERLAPSGLEQEDRDTARLVTRLQAGEDVFGEIYLRYFDRVFTHLRIMLNDSHEAEDLTQEVFIRVLKGLPGYELREVPFRAWLHRVVRNYSLSHLKRLTADVEDPSEIDRLRERAATPPDPDVIDWLTDKDLLVLVERLPPLQRQVIALRYLMDLRSVEIARVMGRSPESVRKLHERAVRFLEARLTALGRRSTRSRIPVRRPLRQARVVRARRFMLTPGG